MGRKRKFLIPRSLNNQKAKKFKAPKMIKVPDHQA